jgi:4-aminobutyrate aminotransferase-like enzyme
MSVAGVVLPPVGYLRAAYAHARAAGAVCVADEVQVGFGRLGEHFWGFEQQGVVPDVVTMGKPFGNGFPLAAVVCRAEIAASFHNGLEYFNTFGGNPVACAAGLAVLDILEREGLQWRAAAVGAHLRRRLQQLADDPSAGRLLGEVRGAGLFIGVELVRDRQTREPATAETSLVCSRLKAHHNILTSVDGPHDSVIVIKPPLCFSEKDADRFVDALRAVLAAMATLGETGLGGVERTPT